MKGASEGGMRASEAGDMLDRDVRHLVSSGVEQGLQLHFAMFPETVLHPGGERAGWREGERYDTPRG